MDRKLLLTLGLSVATLMAFHYFTSSDQSGGNVGVPEVVRPGQSYTVPTAKDLAQPVSTEIDFIDKKISQKEDIKIIETDLCKIGFSTYGGVISTIDFLKHIGKNDLPLRTIQHKSFYEREDSAFLLALDEKTPYYYNLKELTNLDDRYDILFEAESEGWLIQKRYRLYKNTYKVDLFLDFEPKSKDAKSIRPRLFFPAPFIGEIPDDKVEAFSVDVSGKSITKIPEKDLNKIWVMPSIFGAEDKYFAHCVAGDQNNFVQRTFFKLANKTIYPVLQGPEITGKSNFNVSFYVGPKLVDDLGIVDERLEGLLSFGWLSWLCKLLLKLLKLIYSYIGNFGYAIIVLSIVLKIPFIPLSISSKKKMEEYNKYNPTVNRIRMKYKNDLKLQGEEISKFYKDHNISMATPALGCLPLLIQAPIMFALYRVLGGYLDLYQAPFFCWITDLSSKDPYYILPILMGLSMLWQQMVTPVADARQKSMMFFLPLIMTFIFVSFPSGLVLYWLTNNLFMVGEDYLKKLIYR